jgi:copper oxidase (laccase) domain-containing protein
LEKVLRVLNNLGSDSDHLVVAIGPGIHSCCYRRADLISENIKQAEEGGILTSNIIVADDCTSCSQRDGKYLFFSHQRSKKTGEKEGRFIAAVAISKAGR